jgi:hypothetical protein
LGIQIDFTILKHDRLSFSPKPWKGVNGGSLFFMRWNNEYRMSNDEGWEKRGVNKYILFKI